MKSNFAKFVDRTAGAALVFTATTGLFMYYTSAPVAIFCALSVTSCVAILLGLKEARGEKKERMSAAASDMFFDFMFESNEKPSRLLASGLKRRGENAVKRGKGVYLGRVAAFCCFSRVPTDDECARMIARAKHFGAKKLVVLTRETYSFGVTVEGIKIVCAAGDEVYTLFASLDSLPERRFDPPKRKRFSALSGAFEKDKIPRYATLSASMFAITLLTGRGSAAFFCAVVCACLCLTSIVVSATTAIKAKKSAE